MADATLAPPLGDNGPPMSETAKMKIDDALAPLKARFDELMESAGKAVCDSAEASGKCADLVKMLQKHEKRYDSVRADVKEPYADAVSVIDAAPKPFRLKLTGEATRIKGLMLAFDKAEREKAAKAAREQAERERQERIEREQREQEQREAAAAAGVTLAERAPEPEPEPQPAPRSRGGGGGGGGGSVAQGDYGAAAHRTVRKVPVIVDVYALPPEVMNAPKVHDAILSVVRAMRAGNPDLEIKGIEIQDDHGLSIR